MPSLRTGTRVPELGRAARGRVVGREGNFVEVELAAVSDAPPRATRVTVDGGLATMTAEGRVVARFFETPPDTIEGVIYTDRRGWTATPFSAAAGAAEDDEELPARWARAYADFLEAEARQAGGPHPWHAFASQRLRTMRGAAEVRRVPVNRQGLAALMATSTGMLSLQESLQHDRGLRTRFDWGEPTIAVDEVEPPLRQTYPWSAMTTGTAPPEPLAAAAPADFWYFRFDSLSTLDTMLGHAEDWVIPGRRIADGEALSHRVVERYKAQLGLPFGAETGAMALVGSDPYLREGSDVTAIFHAADRSTVQGGTVVGEFVVVSNSPGARQAVTDAIGGRRPRLADEPDFAYLRARDPPTTTPCSSPAIVSSARSSGRGRRSCSRAGSGRSPIC